MEAGVLVVAVVLAVVLMKFFEAIVTPIWNKLKLDPFYKLYVSIVICGGIGWFASLNAFPAFQPQIIGRVLTALAIGVGPSFIYDMQDKDGFEEFNVYPSEAKAECCEAEE